MGYFDEDEDYWDDVYFEENYYKDDSNYGSSRRSSRKTSSGSGSSKSGTDENYEPKEKSDFITILKIVLVVMVALLLMGVTFSLEIMGVFLNIILWAIVGIIIDKIIDNTILKK